MLFSLIWMACAEGPVFVEVSNIAVVRQDQRGTHRTNIAGRSLKDFQACIYKSKPITVEEVSDKYLSQVYMIEVEDKRGKRMFELFTIENMKGNKGRYYKNRCAYNLIKDL